MKKPHKKEIKKVKTKQKVKLFQQISHTEKNKETKKKWQCIYSINERLHVQKGELSLHLTLLQLSN